jgi:hypothetical protein
VVVKFRQGEEIAAYAGNNGPHPFPVKETETQGLVVGKKAVPHVSFHPRPHHMAHHVPKQFAATLRGNEGKHEDAPKNKETALCRFRAPGQEFLNDMPDAEGQRKGNGRRHYRTEKIRGKEKTVRFVKREKPRKYCIAW